MEFAVVSSNAWHAVRRSAAIARLLPWICAAALGAGCDEAPPTQTVAVGQRQLKVPPSARFVKFEEVTEWNGRAWASIAEFNLLDATGAVLDRTDWSAVADSESPNAEARRAIDGDPNSMWHTAWEGEHPPAPPHALTINLGTTVRISGFRYLARQDKLVNGTYAQYRLYVSDNGVDWGEPVDSGDFTSMSSPTVEKTVIFATQTPNRPPVLERIGDQEARMGQPAQLRLRATDPDGDVLRYEAVLLPPGLMLDAQNGRIAGMPLGPGSQKVDIVVSDPKGASARTSFEWTVREPEALKVALKPGEVRFVKLEALSEIEGRPWAAIAEFDLLDATGGALPREGWQANADNSEAGDPPSHAIDGHAGSLWHTRWSGQAAPYPHALVLDLGRGVTVRGFRMLPRQDAVTNGTIARFRFYQSRDGLTWDGPVAEGDFNAMPGGAHAAKTVLLDK